MTALFKAANTTAAAFTLIMLAGCAQQVSPYKVNPDKMGAAPASIVESDEPDVAAELFRETNVNRLNPLGRARQPQSDSADLFRRFSDSDKQQVVVNDLPLKEFVQSVFGKTLGLNYILGDNSKNEVKVNLNIQTAISSRQLFTLSSQLLLQQGLRIVERDNIYYIHTATAVDDTGVTIGFGRRIQDIPDTSGQILQILPLRYGIKASVERTLRNFSRATITPDFEQSALFVQGSRQDIVRIVDLLSMLDAPSNRGKVIGLLELVYLTPADFINRLAALLNAEGITLSENTAAGSALLAVPIAQIGAIALFTADEFILERAEFWARAIDKPGQTSSREYYMYHPRYARATDLGQSVAPLLGGTLSNANRARDTQSAQGASTGTGVVSVTGANISMTVDERSNTLIFYTQGATYKSLLPIIRRLDVLPKQILLDATIAEVTLTDEFAQGFEFAFRSGRLNGGTLGALGVTEMGGFRLNWSDGISQVLARLSASNSHVNILSNPTLVVRDGVAASITVGNDIPTVGSTTVNPGTETQSTTVVYRKTGITLNVTPTINAQGLVVMEIDQKISNTSSSGPQLSGSPSIFERSIKTEVLAQSGQTILLGGLISENNSSGRTEVPGLARLPLLGHFFKGVEQRNEKTELVIFITPRVIDDLDQWQDIRKALAEGLTNIQLAD